MRLDDPSGKPRPSGRGAVTTGWQPIETAPKDGTQIIIAVAGDEYEPGWAWWSALRRAWFIPNTSIAYQMEPTHWMPLPPPPEVKD